MTCQNAQGFLGPAGITAAETVDAKKVRVGPDEALAVLAGMTQLVAAKGKTVEVFDLAAGRPDNKTLLAKLLGPTGNLRAPTARVGTTVVVGFSPDAYRRVFGG